MERLLQRAFSKPDGSGEGPEAERPATKRHKVNSGHYWSKGALTCPEVMELANGIEDERAEREKLGAKRQAERETQWKQRHEEALQLSQEAMDLIAVGGQDPESLGLKHLMPYPMHGLSSRLPKRLMLCNM